MGKTSWKYFSFGLQDTGQANSSYDVIVYDHALKHVPDH